VNGASIGRSSKLHSNFLRVSVGHQFRSGLRAGTNQIGDELEVVDVRVG
jgi:hypothetical protein